MHKKKNEEIRKQLFHELEGYSNDELNRKPSAEEWSAMQILEHLYLMEHYVAERIEDRLHQPRKEKAMWKPVALTVSRLVKVSAPQQLVPSDSYQTIPQIMEKLKITRVRLDELYDNADKELLKKESMKHPVFGNVPLVQWFSFIGLHEKRHLIQLKNVLKKINEERN